MPKPKELATLVVNGQRFDDWESVWVQAAVGTDATVFRFSAAERDPLFFRKPEDLLNVGMIPAWQKLQFKPGDKCEIILAGVLAVTGYIETRQVAYDANAHGVQLIGKSATNWPAKSSVDTKNGSFDGMTYEQVARKVLQNFGVGIKTLGELNKTPFEQLQCQPGENIWDFLERIARPKGIILSSDSFGNFVLIGEHTFPVVTNLYEGINIKAMQCVITDKYAYNKYRVDAQAKPGDNMNVVKASQLSSMLPGTVTKIPSILITSMEQTASQPKDVADHVKNVRKWHDGMLITAHVTVQGWLRDDVNLWSTNENVFVKSPMALLEDVLTIERVTFTQDRATGTLTQIDLVSPWKVNDQYGVKRGPNSTGSVPPPPEMADT
jgi:prophage tail gpP-like protein